MKPNYYFQKINKNLFTLQVEVDIEEGHVTFYTTGHSKNSVYGKAKILLEKLNTEVAFFQ